MHVSELQTLHISKLLEMAEEHGIENANRFRKQDLVFAIVRQMMKQNVSFTCSGTLEILPDASVSCVAQILLTLPALTIFMFRPRKSAASICTPAIPSKAACAVPKDNERYFALVRLDTINGDQPEVCKHKILFENLTPLFPTEQFKLERDIKAEEQSDRPSHRLGFPNR